MANNTIDVQNIFSSIAEKYDKLNSILTFNIDKLWRKKAIRVCDLKVNDKVLDLCCGTGQMIDYACRKVGKNAEVIGLDFNQEMINVGYKRLNHSIGDYKYKLIKGDIIQLPFEDNSFHCVTIAFGLRNIKDKNRALSEIYRVLKPEGKLVCLELSNPELPILKELHSAYLTFILPTIGYIGTKDKSAYAYLRDSVKNFMPKEKLKFLFDDTGFIRTEYLSLTGGIASIHYGVKK
ncbi:bifunctional demethylmenaquinone methyltransferase/2-methoxy-6-polyprenyl-1,4-benzoquinol methylase UbiE [Clostridium magnum]|uniref:Demethylmenaquinone methyltransferase n=1 Tax=Clostridium magnum DSM 2767 TaxID=1121326 RepID=A0A168DU67_9CLOT|nr:bifunctional demethylmenaquinone methyltransferase/2-methoxy-6-polyprenyl-1,4-benzoquinol methylase UbiE [Clostridium magnum]KZL91473.1 demethylmenaquinone methyltransferase [Clostridium magnum DSM 2767]SHH43702.1 demethylmenaquinone methyltransferase / 2-methoxy-6-polyprenyl-1,4-benzoquinol methylase [Clostridium magnum DSM 2767]